MKNDQDYRHNHYVPEWYQKRFMFPGQGTYHYLDLDPETVTKDGYSYRRRALLPWGPVSCFAHHDLYTTRWGTLENRDIEKFFFGKIDTDGKSAVEHFSNYSFGEASFRAFEDLMVYMSTQKIRTPKGLAWLRYNSGEKDANRLLILMQEIRQLFCAIWTECVWQIADASRSETKFIISDHPVVCYNRECFPGSKYCLSHNDPDIRLVATHTYFPLSLDKILILTNLSWVRDPYQNPLRMRPNPRFMRPAIFNFQSIQRDRFLSEEEVVEINYITKKRARRFVASAKREWLYPENRMRSTNWRKLGDGYLLMPDPRHIHGGGEVIIGYKGGRSDAFGAYGHKPWQAGYKDERRDDREWKSMLRFKAEWSAMFGPHYRGVTDEFFGGRANRTRVSDEYHESELEWDKQALKFPGERQRRRRLRR